MRLRRKPNATSQSINAWLRISRRGRRAVQQGITLSTLFSARFPSISYSNHSHMISRMLTITLPVSPLFLPTQSPCSPSIRTRFGQGSPRTQPRHLRLACSELNLHLCGLSNLTVRQTTALPLPQPRNRNRTQRAFSSIWAIGGYNAITSSHMQFALSFICSVFFVFTCFV